jgi:hypothetical protein
MADDDQPGHPIENATEAKTSMLRILTHWHSDGTTVSMLVEDVCREMFFQGSNITRFTSICDLFTDIPSYFNHLALGPDKFLKILCNLFNDTVSISVYIASNGRMRHKEL